MRTLLTCLLLAFCTVQLWSNRVQITNVSFDNSTDKLTFDIAWENSWAFVGSIRDANWVFVKQAPMSGHQWLHADIDSVFAPNNLICATVPDKKGIKIRRKFIGSGNIAPSTITIKLSGLIGPYQDFKVFAIEMVLIPQGEFYVGDGSSEYSFYEGTDTLQPFQISNGGAITLGDGDGELNYEGTWGTMTTTVPATYPNGYDAFFCMKYEISQKQYVDFLNCLSRAQQQTRTTTDLNVSNIVNEYVMSNTSNPSYRTGIRCDTGDPGTGPLTFYCDLNTSNPANSDDDGQHLAANWLSKDDVFAYLDWAALRPMSVFEYEKACRGPLLPVVNEFAWGTAGYTLPTSIIDEGTAEEVFDNLGSDGPMAKPNTFHLARCGYAANDTSSRVTSGAGYYGVMEMSGNVTEFVCTDPDLDEDTFGDGQLTLLGESDYLPTDAYYSRKGDARGVGQEPWPVAQNLLTLASFNGTQRAQSLGGRGVR